MTEPAGDRPVLALLAARGTSARAVPLLGVLGRWADVVSWQRRGDRRPDAVIVTHAGSLPVLDGVDVPVAAWVEHHDEVDDAGRATVLLSSRPELVDRGALHVPEVGLELGRWAPVAPLVRQRRREHGGGSPLDEVLVVEGSVEPGAGERALAAAGACVVSGPATLLAMALATPIVTSAETARRLGLRAGREVEVAAGREAALALAVEVAADPGRAAALSRRARRCAEQRFDLGAPAREVAARLGLTPPQAPGEARLAQRLDELATASSAPIRHRWARALAALDADPQGSGS